MQRSTTRDEKTGERLEGKVAIVTGSTSGIGRAIALSFRDQGARVACADLHDTIPKNQRASQNDKVPTHELIGRNAFFLRTDVRSSNDMRNLVRRTVEEFGRLDIFVNNAGKIPDNLEEPPIWDTDEEIWDEIQNVNVKSVMLGCKHASTQMREQEDLNPEGERGRIINISGALKKHLPSYCASSGAIQRLTEAVASQCKPERIIVNNIVPGIIRTPATRLYLADEKNRKASLYLHPYRGIGIPDDIARWAVFLASENTWATGQSYNVDGGVTIWPL